jgi:hypothetical protein
MPEHEYALQEETLSTGEKRIVLFWSRDLVDAEAAYHRFVALDNINVEYGGKRTKKYRVVERPVPDEPTIVWEESW